MIKRLIGFDRKKKKRCTFWISHWQHSSSFQPPNLLFSPPSCWSSLQGSAGGEPPPAEPPQLAARLFPVHPPHAVAVHPGGAARHPALHPAPAEDPPARAAADRGPQPAVGGGGRDAAAVTSLAASRDSMWLWSNAAATRRRLQSGGSSSRLEATRSRRLRL